MPKSKKDLEFLRLKMQMEIIRTVCPVIMIAIQVFLMVKLY